jgi:hypothetical protein
LAEAISYSIKKGNPNTGVFRTKDLGPRSLVPAY